MGHDEQGLVGHDEQGLVGHDEQGLVGHDEQGLVGHDEQGLDRDPGGRGKSFKARMKLSGVQLRGMLSRV